MIVAMPPILLTQQEAADALRVSPSYLREHGVPRVELPGRGRTRGLVRYDPHALAEWARAHRA